MPSSRSALPVIVTRPAEEARRWVEALGARGFDARALPLIEIAPVVDPAALQALRAAQAALGEMQAAMFVSGNATTHFLDALAPDAIGACATRAWAPGPGTAEVLQARGWPAVRIDAPALDAGQFDSEALWQVVRPQVQAGTRVLIVRGADAAGRSAGRDWLAAQLAAAGAEVRTVVAYRRVPPTWSAPQQAVLAQALADRAVWLFSSSEALANLLRHRPSDGPAGWQDARAVATHPRIAQAARDAGFGVVWESRPTLEALAASIESMR